MTIEKRYFKYRLKNSLRTMIVITVILLVICFLLISLADDGFYYYQYDTTGDVYRIYNPNYYSSSYDYSPPVKTYETNLGYTTVPLLLLCFFTPLVQFDFFKKRKNLDCAFSLPLTQKNMAFIHYLVGLVFVFVPVLAVYLMQFIRITINGAWVYLNLGYLMLHIVATLLFGLIVYTIYAFLFNEANNTIDGVIFAILCPFAFTVLFSFLPSSNIGTENTISWLFGGKLLYALEEATETTTYDLLHMLGYRISSVEFPIIGTIFWTIIGLSAAFLMFSRFGKTRTEKVEDISDSIFGYKTIIPIFVSATVFYISWEKKEIYTYPMASIVGIILALCGYAVYRRGLKFKKSDLIVLGFFGIVLLLSFIGIDKISF